MRVKFTRGLCVAFLYGMMHLVLPSCSSSQQEDADADLESGEQGEEGQEQGEEGSENQEQTANEGDENSQNTANEEVGGQEAEEANAGGEEAVANETANNQVLNDAQTSTDLQGITEDADPGIDAGQVAEAAPAETPVEEAVPQEAAAAPAPVAVSAGKSLPEMGSKMPYIVRVGDTLAQIAQKVYGSSDRWNEMAELTALKDPNMVKPGDVVYYRLSDQTLAFASAYEQTGKAEVKIQKGETLSIIAKRVYGSPYDWKYIWRQNSNIDNPDNIEIGQTIYYLAPAALNAAIDYAKSVKLVDLLPTKVKNAASSQANGQTSGNAQDQETLTGFEIAKNMFDIFASQLDIAG